MVCLAFLATGSVLFAGGPRAVNENGDPLAWDITSDIVYNFDTGPLGMMSNAEARTFVNSAFQEWEDVNAPMVPFGPPGPDLPGDINCLMSPDTNTNHWRLYWRKEADGRSPIIFDDDGSIIDDMFGIGARFDILGIAALDTQIVNGPTISGASMVINGAFWDGLGEPNSPEDSLNETAFKAVVVHEVGHFLNLDHSVLNHELAGDGNPNTDEYVPTMYPLTVTKNEWLASLNPDDEIALRGIYDTSTPMKGIRGAVLSDIDTGFQGANVVVRDVLLPMANAYSMLSGALYFPCNPDTGCTPDPASAAQGAFAIDFIPDGNYTVCVEQIDRRFSMPSTTFVGLSVPVPVLPGPEECHSTGESVSDDPDDVLAVASMPVANGTDIWLNPLLTGATDEPPSNDTEATATDLSLSLDMLAGQETLAGWIDVSTQDLDQFLIPVVAGKSLKIDIDGAELGSDLDPVIGLFHSNGALIRLVDDAIDPDSVSATLDPALEIGVGLTENVRLVVSSYPDLDLNGADGPDSGPYWLRIEHRDCFPNSDSDSDDICDSLDNCPGVMNTGQEDDDGDGFGNACDTTDPPLLVSNVFPADGAIDVSQATEIVFEMNRQIDPASATSWSLRVETGGKKSNGRVTVEQGVGTPPFDYVVFRPAGPFAADSDYSATLTAVIRDENGVSATPFTTHFDTVGGSGSVPADELGTNVPGGAICGAEGGDLYGSSVAVVGDVDPTTNGDLLVGAPNADATLSSGKGIAAISFGSVDFQSDTDGPRDVSYEQFSGAAVGASVAGKGDFNCDGTQDLVLGDPLASQGALTNAGEVYVVFGDDELDLLPAAVNLSAIAACLQDNRCGVILRGDQANDRAGTSVAFVGDINGDMCDDLLIGAPGADPGGGGD